MYQSCGAMSILSARPPHSCMCRPPVHNNDVVYPPPKVTRQSKLDLSAAARVSVPDNAAWGVYCEALSTNALFCNSTRCGCGAIGLENSARQH